MKMALKNKRSSSSQFDIMLNYMERYPNLLSGKISPDFPKILKAKKWLEISAELNADSSGPSKEPKAWIKTWKDWKCYVKKKHASITSARELAGGGPTLTESLTPTENRMMRLIGNANGESYREESAIQNSDEEIGILLDPSLTHTIHEDFEEAPQNSYGAEPVSKKKKLKNLAEEVSHKLLSYPTSFAEVTYQRAAAEDRRAAALERIAVAKEREAAAAESVAKSKHKKLRFEKKQSDYKKRLGKLKFI